jgi:hypothetical protein
VDNDNNDGTKKKKKMNLQHLLKQGGEDISSATASISSYQGGGG